MTCLPLPRHGPTAAELAKRMPGWFPDFDPTPDIVCKTVGDQAGTVVSVENSRRLFSRGKELGAEIHFTAVKGGTHGHGPNGSPSIGEIVALASDFIIAKLTQ